MIFNKIKTALNDKILVIDGAMGTQIQSLGLSELDFRGERFASHKNNLKGCNDVLVLTKPESIEMIHRRYKDAGADIIETNSFNANAISLADYGLEEYVGEINREAAGLRAKLLMKKAVGLQEVLAQRISHYRWRYLWVMNQQLLLIFLLIPTRGR